MEKCKVPENDYPCVLLVTTSYSISNGGGITINNLFGQWPVDKFAISAWDIYIDKNVKWESFYQLGSQEEKISFPLSLLKTGKRFSGALVRNEIINNEINCGNSGSSKSPAIKVLKNIAKNIFAFFGVPLFFSKQYILSEKYVKWINEFRPEILYVVPDNGETAKFMSEIYETLKIPLVVHIMDDFKKRTNLGLFYFNIERRTENSYKKLIAQANLHLSISEGMAVVYNEKYGKKFYPFHNPVDIERMSRYKKEVWNNNKNFRILQIGNISFWRTNSIFNVCKAIASLNQCMGINISLDIFAQNLKADSIQGKQFLQYNVVNLKEPLSHDEILKIIPDYDLVLLVTNFDRKAIKYLHLSYSTNTSELMASGTPILVYAPENIKFVSAAKEQKWAYTVTEENVEDLKKHIIGLINNNSLREQIARKAMEIAKEKDEINRVQASLKGLLLEIIT